MLKSNGVPVRRGVLLYGPPGTGKTFACRYLCGKLPETTRIIVTGTALLQVTQIFNLARMFQPSLVILEDGAEATLLSETAGGGSESQGLHCGAIELLVGANAKLRYVNLQNWGSGVWHFAHQKGRVESAGSLQWTIGALGSRLAKVNQHVALAGSDAATEVNGVMFTEGKQHLTYNTLQHHEAPHCKSDLLYKAARLTKEEFEHVQQHVEKGVEILESIGGSLRRVLPIILAHHDKFDGSGYHPLRGEEIPMEARIISVADVYDALTSDRAYREKWSHEQAREFIVQAGGSHFDPEIVGVWERLTHTGPLEAAPRGMIPA